MNFRAAASFFAFWSICLSAAGNAADLRVGAAAVKITPVIGVPMAGYYSTRLAEGVHDELYSKALVIEHDGKSVALVTLDLISTTREMVVAARKEIERTTRVRGENVMISATYAHTGPILTGGSGRDAALGGSAEVARLYNAGLPERIAQSVREAETRLAPVKVFAGVGREENLSYNRRFFMKDGTVGWNPGKLNLNIVKPAGPIDPDVAVLYFEAAPKKPVATYVNFAMHLDTVGGMQYSADFPYTLSRLLGEIKGEEMVTLFANGCCGNINHIDVGWTDPQKGHSEAERIGTILAADVLQTYKKMVVLGGGPVRVRHEVVKLPVPKVVSEDVDKARDATSKYGTKDQPKFLETVGAFKTLDVAARNGKAQDVEVQVIAVGNELAFVSLPGEIFVELGQAIKKASPFKYTMIAELANGSIGYIPNREAYAQGNYEVVSARCAEGSGELLVEAAARMLKELHRPTVQ